jgi:diguanylate cyclase (GGDEF)-like protein
MSTPGSAHPRIADTAAVAARDRVAEVRSSEALGVVRGMAPPMALLLLLFAGYDAATNSGDQRVWRLLTDLLPMAVLIAVIIADRRGWVTRRNAGWVVVVGSLTVSLSVLVTVVLGQQAPILVFLVIMTVVNGSTALSHLQFVVAQSVPVGGAAASVLLLPSLVPAAAVPDWIVMLCVALAASIAIHVSRGRGFVELASLLEVLEEQAVEDPLTGLGSRRAYEQAFPLVRATAELAGLYVFVVFIDVDGLKSVNDTDGHAAGDDVILTVSRAMRESARTRDLLVRWGGDEFVVLGMGDQDAASRMERSVGQRLAALIPAGTSWSGGISTGTSAASAHEATALGLVTAADDQMYRSRAERGSRP